MTAESGTRAMAVGPQVPAPDPAIRRFPWETLPDPEDRPLPSKGQTCVPASYRPGVPRACSGPLERER